MKFSEKFVYSDKKIPKNISMDLIITCENIDQCE